MDISSPTEDPHSFTRLQRNSPNIDISRPTEDPHSFAKPEVARVIDTRLELNVNFYENVLKGKAILTIERKYSINENNEIILDNLGLFISRVTNVFDGTHLDYQIEDSQVLGSRFCVQLPQAVHTICKIQIEYETSPDSPALYWLTPVQTADGRCPFLLSNNKLIYARAWFPCQDTPSVKFTYSATISVQKHFKVLMSALLQNVDCESRVLDVYEFRQSKPIPSYAVIIAVGSLQTTQLNARINIFAEMSYELDENVDKLYPVETMLKTGESLCGYYFWGRYDICVLPPSIAHFKIECPCVTFIPPSLLERNISLISSLAENISQSWAGNLVTCANYKHLWLNRSFSIFISRKIRSKLLIHKDMKFYLEREGLEDLNSMIKKYGNARLLKCLLPNLSQTLPHEAIKYVPYETGYILLDRLENILGGPSVFEVFLKSYFLKFAFKSINTEDWKNHLYQFFPDKKKMLDGERLTYWYYDIPCIENLHLPKMSVWKTKCFNLARKWANWDYNQVPDNYSEELCDAQKIIFLNHLNSFYMDLDENKLRKILHIYSFENRHYMMTEIRFLWLLLCIKVRWDTKVELALLFATTYCSPNYACPIFQHLYEWEKMRGKAIEIYNNYKKYMLNEIRKELDTILHLSS